MLLNLLGSIFSSKKLFIFFAAIIALTHLPQVIAWYGRDRQCDAHNILKPGTELDFALYSVLNNRAVGNPIWERKNVPYNKAKPLVNETIYVPIDDRIRANKSVLSLGMRVEESHCKDNKKRCFSAQAQTQILRWIIPDSTPIGRLIGGDTPTPTPIPTPVPYRYRTVRFDLVYEDNVVNWETARYDPANVRHQFDRPRHEFKPIFESDPFFDIPSERARINLSRNNFSVILELNIRGKYVWWMKHQIMYGLQIQQQEFVTMEVDRMKRIFLNTSTILLFVTFTASVLHSIFHVLAFEKDLQFWSQKKNFAGVSLRTLALQFLGQFILFLHLLDFGTKIPIFVKLLDLASLLLGASKIWTLATFSKRFPFIKVRKQYRGATDEADEAGMKLLYWALVPILTGYFIYQLFYGEFSGVRSYLIHCASGAVYSFGFLAMLPQLYVNYKLKTVAAMSYSVLVYKIITTFIDDLYTFVTDLPLMYKIACLRDDVVFVIWVIQCFMYPADPTRVNEFGFVKKDEENEGEETPVEKKEITSEKQKED